MKVDPSELSGRDRYRLLISSVVPRPIAFVTSRDSEGRVNLAPFSFFQGVSASPPTISLAVARKRDGTPKDTWRNIETTGEFVVHTVSEDLLDAVLVAAAEFPPGESEVERTELETVPSDRVSVPRLAAARLAMECRLHSLREVNGVALILGEVVRFHLRDDMRVDSREGTRAEADYERMEIVARIGGDGYLRRGELLTRKRLRPEDIP